jgi:RING finger/CHY zinc finger protein 1
MESLIFGCEHYKRKCTLKCNICNELFPCRFCHDTIKNDHIFDRKTVTEIKCLSCDTIQTPKRSCEKCNIILGNYFCDICKLYDDNGEEKGIWHCDFCGICRVGGQDNFFHCKTCNSCLSNKNKETHHCLPDILNNNCPFCLDDMFSSRDAAVSLKCGHYMHSECHKTFIETPRNGIIKCPVCNKSCFDMTKYWEYLDNEILNTPMPEETKFPIKIICCDCNKETDTVFHVVGLKCGQCGSYNTKY